MNGKSYLGRQSFRFWQGFALIVLLVCGATTPIFAQISETDEDVPPPPMVLSKDETAKLEAAEGIRERTQISLQIAENRLKRAEKLTEAADFDSALREIGSYHAAIQNGLKFLQKNDDNESRKIRDNFRRLETAIRAQVPRIESIRRNTPGSHAGHIKKTLDFLRDARTLALESFFSDSVLRGAPAKGDGAINETPKNQENPDEPKKNR